MSNTEHDRKLALPPIHFVDKALAPVGCPGARRLALYFSAAWCGPCRAFTPKLRQFYQATSREDVEIVFVSLDHGPEKFAEYYADMPWLAVDFDKTDREGLYDILRIKGIPALVVFCPRTGRIVSTAGRQDVLRHAANPQACVDQWCQEQEHA